MQCQVSAVPYTRPEPSLVNTIIMLHVVHKKMRHCAQVLPGGGGGVGALGREGNTVHVLNFSKFCGCSHHPQNNLSQKNIIGKIYMTVMANCVLPCGKTLSSLSFRNKMTTFETKC